jgi:hypothetical protein
MVGHRKVNHREGPVYCILTLSHHIEPSRGPEYVPLKILSLLCLLFNDVARKRVPGKKSGTMSVNSILTCHFHIISLDGVSQILKKMMTDVDVLGLSCNR